MPEEHKAAEEAVGWTLTPADIEAAVERWEEVTTPGVRKTLQIAIVAFESTGGRGVELADEIDKMRIALAVRECRENRG